MVKKSKKSKSKRTPLRKKYKILKKVREHHKKKAKEAKKSEMGKRKRPEKDPGIPNEWPFREQELAALERRRAAALEAAERAKEEKKKRRKLRMQGGGDEEMEIEGGDLSALADSARQREAAFSTREQGGPTKGKADTPQDNSLRAYHREVKKVVDAADVIIHVLDARDPIGCRCQEVERLVISSGAHKRIILVLNKIDLVPQEALEKWLKYLRRQLPTIAFKCSTQAQKRNLGQKKGGGERGSKKGSKAPLPNVDLLKGSESLGADNLLQLLKNYSRNQKLKTSITVGIVGLPNVGKSSLINSLKRTRVANVGSTPGVTRTAQEVHLDKNVKLIDSPGIVFSSGGDGSAAVLSNAVKIEKLKDPIAPVADIIRLCSKEVLMSIYKIPDFADVDQFVRHVATAHGRLKKGGIPDMTAAARILLNDWNEGKIPYYTLPPESSDMDEGESAIVTEWRQEFDVDTVFANEATAVIGQLPSMADGALFSHVPSSEPPVLDLEMGEDGNGAPGGKAEEGDIDVDDDDDDDDDDDNDEEGDGDEDDESD